MFSELNDFKTVRKILLAVFLYDFDITMLFIRLNSCNFRFLW